MGSAASGHSLLNNEGDKTRMLARRFTIVCLLITIFGMSLAILVAEKSRPAGARAVHAMQCEPLACAVFGR